VPGEVLVTSYCTALNEKPQGFNPRVLEVCGVLFTLHYGLPDPTNLWCAII